MACAASWSPEQAPPSARVRGARSEDHGALGVSERCDVSLPRAGRGVRSRERLRTPRARQHGAVAELAVRHRPGRGARESARRASARASARDRRRVREGRDLVLEGARDDARGDAANESVLVHVARHGTAEHVEKLVRKYRWTQRRDAAKLAQLQHEQRNVSFFFDMDGEFILNARLPPEIGAVVAKALERAVEAVRPPGGIVSAETPLQIAANAWRADALRLIAEQFLAHHGEETGAGSSADRVQVVVHIDQAILSEQQAAARARPASLRARGRPALALDTARRLACDATIVGIVEGDDGEPLDIGRKTRSIPPRSAGRSNPATAVAVIPAAIGPGSRKVIT